MILKPISQIRRKKHKGTITNSTRSRCGITSVEKTLLATTESKVAGDAQKLAFLTLFAGSALRCTCGQPHEMRSGNSWIRGEKIFIFYFLI